MNHKPKHLNHVVDIIFVLTLFLLFATSLLMLVTLGADIYKTTLSNMEQNYNTRTAFAYISEKARQKDSDSVLTTLIIHDTPALCITQTKNDISYNTYLYLDHDGYLKELLMRVDLDLGVETLNAGQEILPLESFDIQSISHNLLLITLCAVDDEPITFYISTNYYE